MQCRAVQVSSEQVDVAVPSSTCTAARLSACNAPNAVVKAQGAADKLLATRQVSVVHIHDCICDQVVLASVGSTYEQSPSAVAD